MKLTERSSFRAYHLVGTDSKCSEPSFSGDHSLFIHAFGSVTPTSYLMQVNARVPKNYGCIDYLGHKKSRKSLIHGLNWTALDFSVQPLGAGAGTELLHLNHIKTGSKKFNKPCYSQNKKHKLTIGLFPPSCFSPESQVAPYTAFQSVSYGATVKRY